ncbi:uncharacterized protein LOC110112360 [Dendrobium catenatum]|uniref:uncharacterized protein LOC110112360 n=1 Tax=Dendrobium catenatum TaxID=906689 RepID=UPI0009F6505B|nr:uncharacterized protein LOC110112360 [Dendrobium catenatum]
MGWYLCSFKSLEAMEGVISGGPWFVNGHIVGMERWAIDFSPSSTKGLTSPIWIRMPQLPLQCWDENNVAMITSMIGVPLMLDGNKFQWGRREFARFCVRVELDKPLPLGVWVEGLGGRFFQKVEYERISSFCYEGGLIGHDKSKCNKSKVVENKIVDTSSTLSQGNKKHDKEMKDSYGPWVHANYRRNKMLNREMPKLRPIQEKA